MIHVSTWRGDCKLFEIKWKMGRSTNNYKIEECPYCEAGDQCEVVFIPLKPMFVGVFDEFRKYGRIQIR